MKLASRMERIGTETAFEAAARARALEATGRDVIHLEIGEPDFDTPRHVSEAAAHALLDEKMTHYPPAVGIAPLRAALAADVKRWKGIDATPEQVVVTPGAKPIMFYAMLALINEGDEVIYPNPGFPIYESMARYVGGTAVPAPLREANDFRMDVAEVASLVTDKTRLIVTNSPHNPTGSILTPDDVREIARIAIEHDLVVLADEIYGRLQYEGEPLSIATLPGMAERTITLDGFSKTFAMTGWRLGYGIVPDWLVPSFSRLVINSVSGTNAFAQAGAVAALTGPQDEPAAMRTEFQARRKLIVEGLNAIPGVSCVMPHGAFYAFPNMSSFGKTSNEIADHLLYDAGRVRPLRHRVRELWRGLPALQLRQLAREDRRRAGAGRRVARQAGAHRRARARMTTIVQRTADRLYDEAVPSFERWDVVREIIDEAIDLALNYRQSGHPGGSRSKVHMFLALLLSGAMRWDIRKPWRPFARSVRAVGGPHRAARLRDAGRPQRDAAGPRRARPGSRLRLPR